MIPALTTPNVPAVAPAKWWGAGSGVTRTEVLHALPTGSFDLALANGKRHVPMPTYELRTRAEVMHGIPLSGRGADLTVLGGRQRLPAPVPVRSKIEALNGLPSSGRDADIALAGGKQHFPQAGRCGSASPPRPSNETVRDLALSDDLNACGRSPQRRESRGQAAAVRASWGATGVRARSADAIPGTASPRRGGATSPAPGGACSPAAGGATSPRRPGLGSPRTPGSAGSARSGPQRRLSMPTGRSPQQQQARRRASCAAPQQPSISEDKAIVRCVEDRFGACQTEEDVGPSSVLVETSVDSGLSQQDPLASLVSPSLASSASFASLTSELSHCLRLSNSVKSMARTSSTASLVSPDQHVGSTLNDAVEDVLKTKMETAWYALCCKLKIPYEAPATKRGSPTRRTSAHSPSAGQKLPVHPFRLPSPSNAMAPASTGNSFPPCPPVQPTGNLSPR